MGNCGGRQGGPLAQAGDHVRVKMWVKEPIGGWGGVKPGAVGVVRRVDGQVAKILFRGHVGLWHGYVPELEVLDATDRPIPGQHTGMWRHEKTDKYCSTPGEQEGPLCCHGGIILKTDHWSCCGNTILGSRCTGGGVATGLVVQQGAEVVDSPELRALLLLAAAGAVGVQPLVSPGDRVRVKPWVTEPKFKWGNVAPGDVGVVQAVDGLSATVLFAKQPSPWNAYTPELEVLDSSGRPEPRRHTGQWRTSPKKFNCSKPTQLEGPLCIHGDGIVREDHWSCCGGTQVFSRCVR